MMFFNNDVLDDLKKMFIDRCLYVVYLYDSLGENL